MWHVKLAASVTFALASPPDVILPGSGNEMTRYNGDRLPLIAIDILRYICIVLSRLQHPKCDYCYRE